MNARGHFDHRNEPAAVRQLQQWSTRLVFDCAQALACSREHPGDWRPEALLWYFPRLDRDVPLIARQLALRVVLTAGRADIRTNPEIIAAAVSDAMHRVRYRRCTSSEDRARQLGMRNASFGTLRRAAESALLRAIRVGTWRYLAACGYTDDNPVSIERECSAPGSRHAGSYGPSDLRMAA